MAISVLKSRALQLLILGTFSLFFFLLLFSFSFSFFLLHALFKKNTDWHMDELRKA